jgi:hypothetical protein
MRLRKKSIFVYKSDKNKVNFPKIVLKYFRSFSFNSIKNIPVKNVTKRRLTV